MRLEEIRENYNRRYDKGLLNFGVRQYFYLSRGLDLVNSFRYVGAAIFAIYFALKLTSWWWLLIIFAVSIPILILAGRFWTHRMAKALEANTIYFSSYFGRYNIDLSEKTVSLLEEIKDLLKNAKNT